MPSRHPEGLVKVNAWVDQGVAPLVEALSLLDGLVTLDSCQGSEVDAPDAYVRFRVGTSAAELAPFLSDLSARLGAIRPQPGYYTLSLEWHNGGVEAFARLSVAPPVVRALSEALLSVAQTIASEADHLAVFSLPRTSFRGFARALLHEVEGLLRAPVRAAATGVRRVRAAV